MRLKPETVKCTQMLLSKNLFKIFSKVQLLPQTKCNNYIRYSERFGSSFIIYHSSISHPNTHRLLPVHALIEVLELQLAFLLGAGLPDAVGTFDPLLLEGVAASRSLVGLRAALQQHPAVQVDAEPRLQVHERHGADGGGDRKKTMTTKTGCSGGDR